ncbi:hypothetical protein ACWMSZ_004186 [Yersinia enterocolitica]
MLSKDRVKYYTELPSQPFETGKSVFMYEVRQMAAELLSLREQLAELKASIGFNVGDRVCDSVDKFGYGYVVSINNGRSEYPISVQFDKSDKGRIATYTADGRKLSGCPVCLYKTPSVTAAKPAED